MRKHNTSPITISFKIFLANCATFFLPENETKQFNMGGNAIKYLTYNRNWNNHGNSREWDKKLFPVISTI